MSELKEPVTRQPPPRITVEEFDRRAEAGEDLDEYFDWNSGVMIAPGELAPGQIVAMQRETMQIGAPEREQPVPSSVSLSVLLSEGIMERLSRLAARHGAPIEDVARLLIVQQLDQQEVPA